MGKTGSLLLIQPVNIYTQTFFYDVDPNFPLFNNRVSKTGSILLIQPVNLYTPNFSYDIDPNFPLFNNRVSKNGVDFTNPAG